MQTTQSSNLLAYQIPQGFKLKKAITFILDWLQKCPSLTQFLTELEGILFKSKQHFIPLAVTKASYSSKSLAAVFLKSQTLYQNILFLLI